MKQLINQTNSTSIVDGQGRPSVEFYSFLNAIAKQETLDGEGSPEGVVFAQQKVMYWDTITNDFYFKTTNESENTGWVLM